MRQSDQSWPYRVGHRSSRDGQLLRVRHYLAPGWQQFLACNLRAAIWIVLSMKEIVLGHNTLQMMPVDGNRASMNNALYTCIHRCMYKVSQSLHIGSPKDIFQSPWSRFCRDIIDTLHSQHSVFERCRVGQVSMHDLDTFKPAQTASIFCRPQHGPYVITAFQ